MQDPEEIQIQRCGSEELRIYELEMQADAVHRAWFLLTEKSFNTQYSLEGLIQELADAERKARFVCGFEMLEAHPTAIMRLRAFMLNRGYIGLTSQGFIYLKPEGEARTHILLPPEIEKYL